MTCGEVLLQLSMDEHVATTDFAQEKALGRIVQECRIAPWCEAASDDHEPKCEVLQTRQSTIGQSENCPTGNPSNEPDAHPSD